MSLESLFKKSDNYQGENDFFYRKYEFHESESFYNFFIESQFPPHKLIKQDSYEGINKCSKYCRYHDMSAFKELSEIEGDTIIKKTNSKNYSMVYWADSFIYLFFTYVPHDLKESDSIFQTPIRKKHYPSFFIRVLPYNKFLILHFSKKHEDLLSEQERVSKEFQYSIPIGNMVTTSWGRTVTTGLGYILFFSRNSEKIIKIDLVELLKKSGITDELPDYSFPDRSKMKMLDFNINKTSNFHYKFHFIYGSSAAGLKRGYLQILAEYDFLENIFFNTEIKNELANGR